MNATQETSPPSVGSPRRQQSYYLVLFAGLWTSALALLGVYLLDVFSTDWHIMGWYADYIIPAGAILVGLAASSGYGIASWISGVKITRALLLAVLGIQVLVYFAAQYIEFSHLKLMHRNGAPVGFFEYYDLVARSFAWKHDHGGHGEPLGLWGYLFRGLEMVGFAAGSLIVPALLFKVPYCQACRRYMRTRQLMLLAASVPLKKFKKADTQGQQAHNTEQQQAFERGKRITEILQKLATESQADEFRKTLAELAPKKKEAAKLPGRLSLHLISCKCCHAGWLQVKMITGQGKQIKLVDVARNDVQPEFVQSLKK